MAIRKNTRGAADRGTKSAALGSSSSSARPRRTKGQRLYDEVADLERKLKFLMDEIPYEILGREPEICACLDAVDTYLQDAVAQLQKVHDVEVPRYERFKGRPAMSADQQAPTRR